MEKIEKKYTDTLLYEIVLTGKYLKKMSEQLFKKNKIQLTGEEFCVLDFLFENNEITCQRDIAQRALVNRANMGKILTGLEKKGYIKISITTKGKRPVKKTTLTKEGEKLYLNTINKFMENSKILLKEISKSDSDSTIVLLQKIRSILKEAVGADI